MSGFQIRSIIASICFIVFYFGGLKVFDFFNKTNTENAGTFLFLWCLGAILIVFVFYHWLTVLRITWKRVEDPYRGIKIVSLIIMSIVASWLFPFLFPDDFKKTKRINKN